VARTVRVVSVVGKKNCGKTTLIVALAQEFTRRGLRVATVKHGSHPARLDDEGTDTWRHFHEGNADRVALVSPEGRVTFERHLGAVDPMAVVRDVMTDMDVVLVEGFTDASIPRIEVFRSAVHDAPRYHADHPCADQWFAMITDDRAIDVPFPTFRFNDTAWLVAITALAWDHAMQLDA